jgi:hypothetical protein
VLVGSKKRLGSKSGCTDSGCGGVEELAALHAKEIPRRPVGVD